MKMNNVLELIGSTPCLRINKLFDPELEVWMKLEKQNPGGSIKDRIGLAMIEDAERKGLLKKGGTIVEPTSGNTGIGLAIASSVKGYRLILVMPESLSIERRRILKAYGAELILTPKEIGMKGAIEKAREIKDNLGAWMPMQFNNPANPNIHSSTTAKEILEDFPEGLDYIITGVGTGGHISGIARELKKHWPALQVFAVEPLESPVISGGNPGPHGIQGIGAGFIPENLDVSLLDGIVKVSKDDAFNFTRKAANEEGLLIGISSGASLAAIYQKQVDLKGTRILSFAYDTGERYLSIDGLF